MNKEAQDPIIRRGSSYRRHKGQSINGRQIRKRGETDNPPKVPDPTGDIGGLLEDMRRFNPKNCGNPGLDEHGKVRRRG